MKEGDYLTIPQLAKILGITRIAVYKKVKKGQIKALRVGRTYLVFKKNLAHILGRILNAKEKREIEAAVKKTVAEYGEVLKFLGRE